MEYTYKNYITLEEFKEMSGYDLTKRLEIGDLNSSDVAADNFMQDCFNEVVNSLIKPQRGNTWTNNFLSDLINYAATDTTVADMLVGFKYALKEHIVYRFELGDPIANADKETPRFSVHTIEYLMNYHIVFRGV